VSPSTSSIFFQRKKKFFAALELVIADSFWGFGFVATVWAMTSFTPNEVSSIRFLIGGLFGIAVAAMIPSLRKSLNMGQFKLAFLPGQWLTLTLVLQTWGLMYTTATKSGFITTLYVLIVPILEWYFSKKKIEPMHFALVAVALIGTSMICQLHNLTLNIGDLMTFACAIAASVQIFWFGPIRHKIESAFVFNTFQCFWALPLPFLLMLFVETPSIGVESMAMTTKSWIGTTSLVFGSTVLAFALQVKAQKYLNPSVASLIFLLESPIAAIFAAYFLDEKMNSYQWIGAALITVSAAGAVVLEKRVT
jgi:drug/metabolite transporter (DMT)-like permease